MKSTEIQHNVQNIIDNFSKEEFIYDLLIAYGISKTSVTRLKKGDYNLSKVEGEILYKKKIFFKVEASNKLLSSIDEIAKENRILKHKPRFAILTDYKHIVAKDLKLGKNLDIELKETPNYFDFFLPLAGSEVYNAKNDNEADRNASYKMASLYDLLIEENPNIYNSKAHIHELNIFLSRLLFCFFAEDTDIFEENIFTNTLAQHTSNDGSDTHTFLDDLFDYLDTPSKKRSEHSPFGGAGGGFPYVNGGLFKNKINAPIFTHKARKILIELGDLNWAEINPDIFGSMIQAVVIPDYRSDLGMHYTSVINIKKLIKPLFLDELYEEFETSASSVTKLRKLINRISKIKFFDPACGSGNFLIITYKEIRLLEIKILQKITDLEGATPTIKWTSIQLSQFYGIEIDDFAHEMAILSLWLAEHQMNRVFEDTLFDYGKSKPILPLKQAGQITQGNATRIDWKTVCPISKTDEVYIIGNPPYLGARYQQTEHKKDIDSVLRSYHNYKRLDYITCWFHKGSEYIKGNNSKCAFVSTNSICQGEQVTPIWSKILSNKIEIGFAHQSFKWTNNAKGNAGVTVIILGLRNTSKAPRYLFKDNFRKLAKNINGYLLDAESTFVYKRSSPISNFPTITRTNPALDDGHFLLNEVEKDNLISEYPNAKKLIKPLIGAAEFLQGKSKFCLWIEDEKLELANQIPPIKKRIDKVRIYRMKRNNTLSKDPSEFPHRFLKMKMANDSVLFLPTVSSVRREYIPCGFFDSNTVVIDPNFAIYDPEPTIFAIISSRMHMVWVRAFSGKLKTDYRYSSTLCYNTFPFPNISTKQKENLNLYVFAILDERAKHPSKTMAQLYNPDTMPKGLLRAHQELDTAIEQCYRLQPFKNNTERLEYLFKHYEEMIKKDTLFAKQKKTRKKKTK